jgi:two-component system LytT family response regulator
LQLQNLVSLLQESHKNDNQRIALPSARETRFVTVQHIIHCESQNSYTLFYLIKNEKILVSKAIYEYEYLLLPYGFIRCHQSHLVNRKYIKSWIKKDGDFLLLEDGTELPISRQKKMIVKKALA